MAEGTMTALGGVFTLFSLAIRVNSRPIRGNISSRIIVGSVKVAPRGYSGIG